MISKFIRFVKTYFTLRTQKDPEKIEAALGKPATLELTQEQAEQIDLDFTTGGNPADVARRFFKRWPRTDFRYFMAVSPDGTGLEFTNGDLALDGVELIQAAMVKLGAVVFHEEHAQGPGWYYQTAHPMVKRMAELGADQGDLTAITKKKSILA